ncbi:MAG: 4Fe-4S binding protein, partial [Synergistaceae bacterium]|nr:4Fe-4S binding protein [Synergistaceae bacterium]
MRRKIIKIDEEKCDGCGLCADACHESAIGVVDGKAKLLRDEYCDGLGNCLPACPRCAISFEEREAAEYDEKMVKANAAQRPGPDKSHSFACPGAALRTIERTTVPAPTGAEVSQSELRQWPVQIRLIPAGAPCFENANLLVAADCAAYTRASFHEDFMRNKVTLIGCPKLDDVDYSEKLTAIIGGNPIRSVTVVRMEVPCCGGIEKAVVTALKNSGKVLPWRVVTL